MNTHYLNELNEQQRKAVEHIDTPQLVIAGAGSGKTRVLIYKIIHLLSLGYQPWRILALTFTNKAAREMKKRITETMGEEYTRKLWMGTFHSIFLRILHQHAEKIGYKPDFTIYDTSDSKALVKSIIKDMELDDKVYNPSTVYNAISSAKNALISPWDYAQNRDLLDVDRRAKKPLIYAIYRAYQERCIVSNAMDFDDILFYTHALFRDNPDILNHYREFFQYVLVDEYQDTNYAQHRIILQLTQGQNNLSVVGDDAQSIYSFRGAKLANILNMKHHYPNLSVFKLERNYRSTKSIIEAANSLIENNTQQIKKEIYSENENGSPIEVVKSYSDYEEGYLIAGKITSSKMLNRDSYADYAILYRTNAQSRVLEESLRKRNIPYKIYSGLSFYQRKEIKDAVAYFRITANPDDDEALKRIINFPSRGIGDTTVGKISHAAIEKGISMWQILDEENLRDLNVNSGTRKKLEGFRDMIKSFIEKNRTDDAYSVARHIVGTTGILSMLVHDRTPESISKQENINELLNGVRLFTENSKEERGESAMLSDFLNEVSLATDLDEADDKDDAVTLMTVHAAKGLEFKNVMIVGVEEDLFPSSLSTFSAESIEEERRLLYVAITRAEKQCVISYAQTRYRNGQTVTCAPSRFLREINRHTVSNGRTGRFNVREEFPNPLRKMGCASENKHNPKQSPWFGPHLDNTTKHVKEINGKETEYSPHSLKELEEGMLIEHSRFGKGRIKEKQIVENTERIVVEFANLEIKTLLLKFARFKILPFTQ